MTEIIHRCPARGESLTPCCGKSPFELDPWMSRMDLDASLVTCNVDPLLQQIGEMRERNVCVSIHDSATGFELYEDDEKAQLLDALEAVLKMGEMNEYMNSSVEEDWLATGRNQFRAEMREELGVILNELNNVR